MKEERLSKYRVLPILGIFASMTGASAVLCYFNKLEFDEICCIAFVILGFMPIIIYELWYERTHNKIANNGQSTYGRLALGVFLSCLLLIGISFLPEFYRPVLLIPLCMAAFSNDVIAITTGLFCNVLLSMVTGGSYNELLSYTILIIIGGTLSKALINKSVRIYISLLFLFTSILFPNIFYYLTYEQILLSNQVVCVVCAVSIAVFAYAFYPKAKAITEDEINYQYEDILSDNYVQVREVHDYSISEYLHARKVSKIAKKYAKNLGLNSSLAAAAGFYYRLGRWEGEPVVESGVTKALQLCFPDPLIQILREYNGEKELPSTPESALIHIIDGLLIKLELLEKQVGTSQWNREVLIYQTLNDFSTAGLYDKSGLSINAFIKVREWLAKEEML